MASRAEQKDRARQARLQAEETTARAVCGRRLRNRLAAGTGVAVVGPDGAIEHRADYGGPPNFTMHVPVRSLLADVRRGMRATGSSS